MELLMVLIMGLSAVLVPLGGTKAKIKLKWLRRYVLPILLGFIVLIRGLVWWESLLFTFLLGVALSLPYGEETPYWLKALVFGAIFASTLFIGRSWWQIIGPIVMLGLFRLSNFKYTQHIVFHKAWEFIGGGILGICVADLVSKLR